MRDLIVCKSTQLILEEVYVETDSVQYTADIQVSYQNKR
jgi:hypothetical protein